MATDCNPNSSARGIPSHSCYITSSFVRVNVGVAPNVTANVEVSTPMEVVLPGYAVPTLAVWGRVRGAGKCWHSPAELRIGVGYGVEPIEPDEVF